MYGESKIKGSKGPKKPGDVTLPPIKAKKKKGHDVDGNDISWT